MAIQIIPITIDGFDGLNNMFRLNAVDDEGNIGLDILTTVTVDEWPEISDAILRGLMFMCPGSGVRFGQAALDEVVEKIKSNPGADIAARFKAETDAKMSDWLDKMVLRTSSVRAPTDDQTRNQFKVGDTIYEKVLGDRWPGTVVAVFNTMQGEARIVVECIAPEVKGDLHIYNPEQLIVTARKR
jgi:hypothetical protein